MDSLEIEENLFVAGDAKLHGEMVRMLSDIVFKVLEIFPYIEGARPRSKSGIQALCSLHVALEKAKGLLQHCSDCSKLYLAITGDSILMKFEKAKHALKESLRRVEDIVPEAIGCQIVEAAAELDDTVFALDESEKQAGDEVISLLQKDRKSDSDSNDSKELEVFHQAALRLGITSSRAALTERRALKKLIERARAEEDKRKESIVSYLYHLMRKYSKFFRSEFADDTDSQGSAPCSPTISFEEASGTYSNGYAFEKQLSKLRSFNFKQTGRISGGMPVPPEEFRCPISLQLLYDPVIISSGQTYERACIEKWFSDGHSTCPKTQQQLIHLSLTPNYCVKGLITSWCEHNGVPIPNRPPDSLDVNYQNLASFQGEAMHSISLGNVNSCNQKVAKVVPLEENVTSEEFKQNDPESPDNRFDHCGGESNTERYESLLVILQEEEIMQKKCRAVQQMRYLLKNNEEGRNYMADNGAVDALVEFLRLALQDGDQEAREAGAMALFNIAVKNKRNKELLVSAGLLSLMEEMILNSETQEFATALYLNLSCLENAKSIIGSSESLPFLVQLLHDGSAEKSTCKYDALYTIYNLSTYSPNIPALLSTSLISYLHAFLVPGSGHNNTWAEKALAVMKNLASSQVGREEIVSTPSLVSNLVAFLDMGDPIEQEQSVSCLLILCNGDEKCSQMVLQEGAIPSLVSISANGNARGKDKAQKLLRLFREQRQREQAEQAQNSGGQQLILESKALSKSRSEKIGRVLSSVWKSKHFSVYQCSSW